MFLDAPDVGWLLKLRICKVVKAVALSGAVNMEKFQFKVHYGEIKAVNVIILV